MTPFVTFQVRSCNNASFGLFAVHGNDIKTLEYEIIIGAEDNTQTYLMHNGDRVDSAMTLQILSCHELRHFWARWSGDVIEFGSTRTVGEHRILHYDQVDPRGFDLLSVSSGQDYSAEWQFHVFDGKSLYLCRYAVCKIYSLKHIL